MVAGEKGDESFFGISCAVDESKEFVHQVAPADGFLVKLAENLGGLLRNGYAVGPVGE